MKQLKVMSKQQEQEGGTYIATKSGRVGRTYGLNSPYESMDTTGYSKGKKEFELKRSGAKGTSSTNIKREYVPSTIASMKKGATRVEDWTKK